MLALYKTKYPVVDPYPDQITCMKNFRYNDYSAVGVGTFSGWAFGFFTGLEINI